MDPQSLLERLCHRHGVPPARGGRLLPLVRWALESPSEIRVRILAIVEETLSWHARDLEGEHDVASPESHSVLLAVARVLHTWSPSERILGLEVEGGPGGTAADAPPAT